MADRRVTFAIQANIKNFTSALKKAERSMRRFGRDMKDMGSTLTQNVTVPLGIVGGLAIKTAADFESSFADIEKTVNATGEQFANISKEMREMAKTVPTSVNELNRIGGVAGQLGVEAENIVEFTKTIAMLGDTTDIAGEQAALALSRFMNVMGTAQSDIDRLGSTVVGLGNNFAAMESEIIETASSMAPLGNSIGLTEQQVLAFATTIAASGGKIEAASTAFQKTANTMKQAVIEGNANLTTFAETAGMTASQFQQAFQRDAGRAIVSFLEGLRAIQKEGGSTAVVLDRVGLADQRLVREFGKVLGNLDDLNRALPQANEEWESNSALTEEAAKRYDTFNSRLKIFRNRLSDVGITIGNMIIPYLTKLMEKVEDVVEIFASMSKDSQKQMLIVAGLFAAGGPLMMAIGQAAIGITAFAKLVRSRFVLITAAISLAIGRFVQVQQLWENFISRLNNEKTKEVDGFFDALKSGLGGIAEWTGVFEGLNDGLEEFQKLISGLGGRGDPDRVLDNIVKSAKDAKDAFANLSGSQGTGGGSGEGQSFNTAVGSAGMGGIAGMTARISDGLSNMKVKASEFASVSEAAAIKAVSNFRWMGYAMTDIVTRFTDSFGQGMQNVIVQGEKLVDVLRNIGKLLASSVIQKGIKVLLTGGIAGASGFLGIGGGILGAIGIPGLAHGGIVPSGFPNDTYPAMLTSGETVIPSPKPLPSGMGGSQVIHNVIQLDGKTVYDNQKEVNRKINR